jgi:hypothetical protein
MLAASGKQGTGKIKLGMLVRCALFAFRMQNLSMRFNIG